MAINLILCCLSRQVAQRDPRRRRRGLDAHAAALDYDEAAGGEEQCEKEQYHDEHPSAHIGTFFLPGIWELLWAATPAKRLPLWGFERPENSPVDCFQRERAGKPMGSCQHPLMLTDEVELVQRFACTRRPHPSRFAGHLPQRGRLCFPAIKSGPSQNRCETASQAVSSRWLYAFRNE